MSPTTPLQFVPLTCPSCGRDLPALEEDVVFACVHCRRAVELNGNNLAPLPLKILPCPTARSGFHLPVWDLGGGLRVPAFNTREVLMLARRFSGRPLETAKGLGTLHKLVGGSLPSREAGRAIRFLGLLPEAAPPQAVTLVAVPFVEEGSCLLDLWTGARLYRETIDRVDELVRANLDRAPTSA